MVFSPIVTFLNVVIPENALDGMNPDRVIESGNPANADVPIEVIEEDDIVIFFKVEHLLNADAPIVLTLAGRLMDVILEQPSKADMPIFVTLAGMLMDVIFEQFWNT